MLGLGLQALLEVHDGGTDSCALVMHGVHDLRKVQTNATREVNHGR